MEVALVEDNHWDGLGIFNKRIYVMR